jgi:hypothetical protein
MGYGIVRVAMLLSGLQKADLHEGRYRTRRNLLPREPRASAGRAVDHSSKEWPSTSIPGSRALRSCLAQIAASVPATALFPVVLLLLIKVGGGAWL